MKLYKVREPATWVDPFGDSHQNLSKYVRLLEVADVGEPTTDFKMFDNGYEPPYKIWIYRAEDGREWVEITNHIDFWGGTWYRPLFVEPRDPALHKGEIGPSVRWLTERELKSKRLVNYDGKAVDMEGNLL